MPGDQELDKTASAASAAVNQEDVGAADGPMAEMHHPQQLRTLPFGALPFDPEELFRGVSRTHVIHVSSAMISLERCSNGG